ncbi:NAD(P)H-binding protein [Mycobacterium sp. ITM-2016-00318]|uniref:NmrA family NAD(P)-binding protein n=1 Tax=Mycobacterium sp. ITM-2016-00318 TaxID=2099693 RepID=UPI000CF8B0E1|nr:NAD(P)H-binding protein [Mycobacterium sp. ITM-2016-00318]WNG94088.1 NAD(P)H-binding protein [Mycobacterium sp. ITM-2016-00318]
MYLVTGAGGGTGSVSRAVVELLVEDDRPVRAMVRRDDERARGLRDLGADVVVGDLTNPQDVATAMTGVDRMFFNMSVSPDYLTATSIVCAVALEAAPVEVIVNMSQMTVSQMTLTSTTESNQHRLHWLAEHIMNWSRVPVVHVRPTVFMENPLLTMLAAASIRERGTLVLPFGAGRTSPIAAADVARVVATILRDPAGRIGDVYELTGPEVLGVDDIAEQYSRALGRPVTAVDTPLDEWTKQVLTPMELPPHVGQHIATMARLHREGRYDRSTDDVASITGAPAQTVEQYVAAHAHVFS